MFAAFTLLFMCATAVADHHQPCQSPNMTGVLSVSNMNEKTYTDAAYVYDSGAKRLRFKVIQNETFNYGYNSTKDMDVLMLFKEGVLFEINAKNQSCKKKSVHVASNPLQLPSNALFLSKLNLGRASVPEEGLQFNIWSVPVPGLKEPYIMSASMGCLPLSIVYSTDSTMLLISNVNVEVEIKDPDYLTLPSFCEGEPLEETPEGTVNSFFNFFS